MDGFSLLVSRLYPFLINFSVVTAVTTFLKKLLREVDGPTAVEYAVLLALIVAACIGAVHSMAHATAGSFDRSAEELAGVLG
jgi:pilus assembly protein Flp/PilA